MKTTSAPRWMSGVLWAAALYNLVWGVAVVLFPGFLFDWLGMLQPSYPALWQCVGMLVAVYGIAYALAASAPLRHWPVVLAGLLGKILGPLGFLHAARHGELPWTFGWTIVANDLIWWLPFGLILYRVLRIYKNEEDASPVPSVAEALRQVGTYEGRSLEELTNAGPVLLIFLRHFG